MSKAVRNARRSSKRKRQGKSHKMPPTIKRPPQNLASLIRGLYGRVARQLDVDPSYVSRIARGERRSEIVQNALRDELNRIIRRFS